MDPNATLAIANDTSNTSDDRLTALRNLAHWLGKQGFTPDDNLSVDTLFMANAHGHDDVACWVYEIIEGGN